EVAARRASLAGADAADRAGGEVVHELLIAGPAVARGLEDEPLAIGRPVSLGVLSAKGDLPELREVRLAVADQAVGAQCGRRHGQSGAVRRASCGAEREAGEERQPQEARFHGRLPSVATRSFSTPPRFTVMRTSCPGFRERSANV